MRQTLVILALGFLSFPSGRAPQFSGTWLVTEPQTVSGTCCFVIEQTDQSLIITQTPPGFVTKYDLTGIGTPPVALGGAVRGTVVYASHWDGEKLVTEMRRDIEGQTRYLGPSGEMIVERILDTSPAMASSAVGRPVRWVYRRKP